MKIDNLIGIEMFYYVSDCLDRLLIIFYWRIMKKGCKYVIILVLDCEIKNFEEVVWFGVLLVKLWFEYI